MEVLFDIANNFVPQDPVDEDVETHDAQPDGGIEQEEQEIFVIAQANAIARPWAVVVHSQYALLASRTVVGPWGPDDLALRAILIFPHFLDFLAEFR